MRNLYAVGIVAMAALIASPALSADYPTFPQYPTVTIPELPPVDYGLGGSFYLRGSISGAAWQAVDASYCACISTFDSPGWGMGAGIGAGYETGDGMRYDATLDYLHINELTSTAGPTVDLRAGLLLVNAYYDFGFGHDMDASGGFGAYVGGGIGAAKLYSTVSTGVWGTNVEAAAALMAGVTYDMGNVVADLGYRGTYINKIMDQPVGGNNYIINHNFIHELRASVRYRFN